MAYAAIWVNPFLHPSWCLQRQQHLLHTDVAHTLRVRVAEEARAAHDTCAAVITRLAPSREVVESLWEALKVGAHIHG
jgi:hypothetical protein